MTNSVLNKRPDESNFEYHRRIIEGKLGDKTLSDYDYSELSTYAYGKEYSTDVARRMFYGSKRTLDCLSEERIEKVCDSEIVSKIDEKMIELRKERQKFYDQRNAFNKVIRDRSRQEELNEILVNAVHSGNLPQLNYMPMITEPTGKDLLVSLNDIHYGIDIHNAWNTYNPDICRDMMVKYLHRILEIAETHQSDDCIVYNCGDSISGKIHPTIQISNKENVIEQVKGVSELIAEFLAELSSHFRSVRYYSVSGNHSRLDTKENSPYDERLDDLIEWYLKARLQEFENICIDSDSRIDPTMFLMDIRGKTYCGVHGDYDGTPDKVAALKTMAQKPLYAILSGHKHHNMCNVVQGVKTVMSGGFLGIDDFCIQKRIFGQPEQMVCVCDDTGIVCHYDVEL